MGGERLGWLVGDGDVPVGGGVVLVGDARDRLGCLPDGCVDLSFWSPPYFVGKSWDRGLSFEGWQGLLRDVVVEHARLLRPGGFMVVNIADILCFSDPDMPRFAAENVGGRRVKVSREDVLGAVERFPGASRGVLAEFLGCSEQTVQRRLEGNNVRGGKQVPSTRVFLTGELLVGWALEAGLYLYDQRIWHKDPGWVNSRWHSVSYRAVDEFEHVFVFWCPGVTVFDRGRLSGEEWAEWGSRGVWRVGSVRRNVRHEAEFPEELARRVVRLFSPVGGVVLDPFVGSGTTTAVAAGLGRRWVGVEVDEGWASLALERSLAASAQLDFGFGV